MALAYLHNKSQLEVRLKTMKNTLQIVETESFSSTAYLGSSSPPAAAKASFYRISLSSWMSDCQDRQLMLCQLPKQYSVGCSQQCNDVGWEPPFGFNHKGEQEDVYEVIGSRSRYFSACSAVLPSDDMSASHRSAACVGIKCISSMPCSLSDCHACDASGKSKRLPPVSEMNLICMIGAWTPVCLSLITSVIRFLNQNMSSN